MMSEQAPPDRLWELLNAPAAPLFNWQEIIAEIDKEFGRHPAAEQCGALLAVFQSTMDIVEGALAEKSPDGLQKFKEARLQHYKTFIYQESTIGGQICAETLDVVTRREIAVGRMAPDDGARKLADMAMAAPHFSRAELIAMAAASPDGIISTDASTDASRWRRAGNVMLGWLRSLSSRLRVSTERREAARRRALGYDR